jgi:hypothetical protein
VEPVDHAQPRRQGVQLAAVALLAAWERLRPARRAAAPTLPADPQARRTEAPAATSSSAGRARPAR